MSRDSAKILTVLTYFLMLVLAIVFAIFNNRTGGLITVVVGCIVVLILSRWLRCPHCGKNQGRGWLQMEYCPYCGEYLDDNL